MLEVLLDHHQIIVWRFWENDGQDLTEKTLIFNLGDSRITLKVYLAELYYVGMQPITKIDSSKGIILGPLELEPYEYKIVDSPNLNGLDYHKYYLNFIENDTNNLGLMNIKQLKPPKELVEHKIITTQNYNSGSDIFSAFWEQDFIFLKNGEKRNIYLKIIGNNKKNRRNRMISIIDKFKDKFNNRDLTKRNEELIDILKLDCSTLKYYLIQNDKSDSKSYNFEIPNKQDTTTDEVYRIVIKIKASTIKKPVSKEIFVRDMYPGGWGTGFTLPFCIIP